MKSDEYFELEKFDLYKNNSLRIHTIAEKVYFPYTINGLLGLCEKFKGSKEYIIIGKGSNSVFVSNNHKTPIICTNLLNGIEYTNETFVVQCGVSLSELSWFALEKSVEGYEFLEDIPGSVGGALYMNAGTYDDTISQLVVSVKIYDFDKNEVLCLSESDLKPFWGKRESYFSLHNCCILECVLNASSLGDSLKILEKILATKKARYLKQPREFPSAGSVFKRPYFEGKPVYVWELMDELGLRGFTIGGACVSEKHPGFIVNKNNCTGADVEKLLIHCKSAVKSHFGIDLQEEWKIIKED